jgi:hypothetical protein
VLFSPGEKCFQQFLYCWVFIQCWREVFPTVRLLLSVDSVLERSVSNSSSIVACWYTVGEKCFQQFLYCWVLIQCWREVFPAVPLMLRVDSLQWELACLRSLHSNGSACYNAVSTECVIK